MAGDLAGDDRPEVVVKELLSSEGSQWEAQELVLGSVLLYILITDFKERLNCTLTNLQMVLNWQTLKCRLKIQRILSS